MSDVGDRAIVTAPVSEARPASFGGQSLTALDLYWLPAAEAWPERIKKLDKLEDRKAAWTELVASGQHADGLHPHRTARSDAAEAVCRCATAGLATKPVRLAVLGSSTVTHLHPALAGRSTAPRHLAQDLRMRLRPIPAGADRSGLRPASSSSRLRSCSRSTPIT